MPENLTLDFCTLEIYDTYVISTIDEGVHVNKKMGQLLIDSIIPHYKNIPFVYITNRKYSYSIDPTIYLKTSKINDLLGFAIVSTDKLPLNNVKVEKLFANKPLETFNTLKDAIFWAKKLTQIDFA